MIQMVSEVSFYSFALIIFLNNVYPLFPLLSQKASISKLETLLDEERELRRDEREKAAVNLKNSIQKVRTESQEELKRLSDAALRREKEQQEVIYKLQV